jgi:CHASE1-domain containing sensor protein
MRKFIFGLGVVFMVILVAGGASLFMLARHGSVLDAESKAYIQDAVVKIASDWDADELLRRGTARLLEHGTAQDIRNLFDAARRALERMQEFHGAQGQVFMMMTPAGKSTTAQYDAKATFEKGDADIVVSLVNGAAGWRIEGFHINSTALMRTLVGTRS